MANAITPLRLFLRQQGDLANLIDADLSTLGEIGILRPLKALNSSAESFPIHSVFMANEVILAGIDDNLKYWTGSAITSLLTSFGNDNPMSFAHAGNWVFIANSNVRKAVYLPTPAGTDWGVRVPTEAPTVVAVLSGTNNKTAGVYSCYYRHKVTMPDGSIIRTDLSPVAAVTLANSDDKFLWTDLIDTSFEGATTIEKELFRQLVGWDAIYLVTTVAFGTVTYDDDQGDTTVQANTAFDQTGYYPPPDSPDIVAYHPGADRVFAAKDNAAFWSVPGEYHTFIFNTSSDTYTNTNEVFLAGENITGMIILDEQMYFGSAGGFRRLRGADPASWRWEDTGATKGPVSERALSKTRWGALYPGNDGRIWMFNGFESSPILEYFVFDVKPSSLSHATFDGRYYRLFYKDETYPSIVVDFFGFPNIPPRVVKSVQDADSSYYDKFADTYITGTSDGFIKTGVNNEPDVEIIIRTPEIPVEALDKLGDMGTLVLRLNTNGGNVEVTTIADGIELDSVSTFSTDSYQFYPVSVPLGCQYTLQFEIKITTKQDFILGEPLMLTKFDGG